MASIPIQITEAVLTDLNAADLSIEFTAIRSYRPVYDLKDLATLKVNVVPRARASIVSARNEFTHSVEVDISIQKKLSKTEFTDNTEPDALMDLVEEIVLFFNGRDLSTLAAATFAGVRTDPVYSPEHWEQYRQFTSVITVTYDLPAARI